MPVSGLRSLVEDFPVTSAYKLSSFLVAPYSGSPWKDHDAVTGAVAGTSGGRQAAVQNYVHAPTVGTAIVTGRTSAVFAKSFTPAVLSLKTWWRATYDNNGANHDWLGTASLGSSGSNLIGEATNPPTQGTAINGFKPADFNGTNQVLRTPNNLSSYFNSAGGSIASLFYPRSAAAPQTTGAADPGPFHDSGSYLAMGINNTGGGQIRFEIFDTARQVITKPCSLNTWHFAQMKWDGLYLYARIDTGDWERVACTGIGSMTGIIYLAMNYSASAWMDGLVLETACADFMLSDSNFDDYLNYARIRYPAITIGS